MVRRGVVQASVVGVRSGDPTSSAELPMAPGTELPMAPGTSLLAWREESSLPPSTASALMEGGVWQGGETSRRTVRDDGASVVDPRSRDLADSADPKQEPKSKKIIMSLKNYANNIELN